MQTITTKIPILDKIKRIGCFAGVHNLKVRNGLYTSTNARIIYQCKKCNNVFRKDLIWNDGKWQTF